MVELCHYVVSFIGRSFVSQVASSLGGSRVDELHQSLTTLASSIRLQVRCLSERRLTLEQKEASSYRFWSRSRSQERDKQLALQKRSQLLRSCSTYNHKRAWEQAQKQGWSSWIFQTEQFHLWQKATFPGTILRLSGRLGTGKTIVAANVVSELVRQDDTVVAYFFCRFDEPQSLKSRNIIGSILRQLLDRAPSYFPAFREFQERDYDLLEVAELTPLFQMS